MVKITKQEKLIKEYEEQLIKLEREKQKIKRQYNRYYYHLVRKNKNKIDNDKNLLPVNFEDVELKIEYGPHFIEL